jgi:RNA recognition motif-containing protein
VALLPQQAADPIEKVMNGFSPNYMGNIHIDKNKSANIPENENCSLWLTKLPPNLTYTDLLAAICDAGRVYQTHINRPVPDQGHHTSAGKVVFFDRASAERFYNRFVDGGLVIPAYPGFDGRVTWNRVLAAAIDGPNNRDLSRVLLISGPKEMVNADFLTQYFRSKLDFNIDCIIDHGGDDYRGTIEYRFASYRCQAESAKMAITRELGRHNVQVWFWTDPCDVGADSRRRIGGQLLGDSAGQDCASGHHPARTAILWRQVRADSDST